MQTKNNSELQWKKDWEQECDVLIGNWQRDLKDLADKRDDQALKALKAAIDAQLALSELRVKVHQAGHPVSYIWSPIIFPTLGAILGAFIGGLMSLMSMHH
jgi:hypothetical protein